MDDQDFSDSQAPAASADGEWVAHCLSELMERHGVHSRQQAAHVAQVCALSISQARRKLKGASWTFDEVLALCRQHDESLDAVFADPVFLAGSMPSAGHTASHAGTSNSYPATLLVDDAQADCEVRIGALHAADAPAQGLLATLHPIKGWLVGSFKRLARESAHSPRYAVEQLTARQAERTPSASIAVLDDDRNAAEALADWFTEMGYEAHSFQSADALMAHQGRRHDAYVIDLILGAGQTSQAVVQRIRADQPDAPIVLLTGRLRDDSANEATLTTILRTQGVTFLEKPVRPAVLTAAIQSSLDRAPRHHA